MSVDLSEKIFQKSDFNDCQTVIVAISGGSDSTALLFLLRDFLAKWDQAPKILAVTVDHRLRPESALEAEQVASLCQKIGIEHQTVCWVDGRGQSGLSHQARIARYGLLVSQAEKSNADMILTGHTLNDQAETYQMRLYRGKGRGLACMPRESLLMRKIRLIRPLLNIKREELRHYLLTKKQDWIDDPTNENPHYERVRIRQSLSEQDIDRIALEIKTAAKERLKQSLSAAHLIRNLDLSMQHALCILKEPSFSIVNDKDYPFVIGVIASIMGGALFLPTISQIHYIKTQMQKHHDTPYRFTLLGCIIEKTKNTLRFWREARHQSASIVPVGLCRVWDSRFRIDNHDDRPLRAATPSYCDIHSVAERQGIKKSEIHFLSLLSSLALYSHSDIEIPVLTGGFTRLKNITCERFMHPFGWLISSYDFPLFEVLHPIFERYLPSYTPEVQKT
ncbi:tRNA lysidine(34) synthetase TilS [Bartonella tamiae]|uniref:tRNA(Ile)-lysidine synthase n=1 Tax=Bartonella tamiae Th239 TaxID=1094558 RepID=J1K3L3_9HYPH|nr:tRNA lysidine(34) synthetase TilS [Bartonella tamiae]EJF91730.1 tRNA(Ile)-lysidine synthetase [Bartonella tamiae Th239]EJF92602.1 tRNA(Ile)-lysidine synthetase [Bartonella tamiae Th307]